MINKKKIRNLHSTLGYLYVGLIISFSLSGIMMNHRESWHPEKYTIKTSPIELKEIPSKENLNDESVELFVKGLGIEDKIRRHMVKKGELRIMCNSHDIEVDLKTGKGEITEFVKTPFVSHIMGLHKSTSNWWIYYSDIFALSLITIAVTGILLIPNQAKQKRKAIALMIAGVIFPIIFILFLAF